MTLLFLKNACRCHSLQPMAESEAGLAMHERDRGMTVRKRQSIVIALAMFLLTLAPEASAQHWRPYEFWAGAGFVKLFVEDAPDGSYSAAGGMDFALSSALALGAEVGYFNFGSKTIGGRDSETSFSAVPVTGQLSYYASEWENILPYLRGGAGLYHLRATHEGPIDDDPFTANRFGLNLGGGIRISGDTGFSYAVEARYHVAFTDRDNWDMIELLGKLIF